MCFILCHLSCIIQFESYINVLVSSKLTLFHYIGQYLEDNNVDAKVAGYIREIEKEWAVSKGNNIMIKMGADFTGDNAHTW